MIYKKICECCGKEFETNRPYQKYCLNDHYLPCPICGKLVLKTDRDFTKPPQCCSTECSHKLRQQHMKPRKCIFCGKEFYPKSGVALVCDDEHYKPCEICGKLIPQIIGDDKSTCSDECQKEKMRRFYMNKYGVDHPMKSKKVQENHKKAMMEKYGVESPLQNKDILAKQQISAYKTNMEHSGVPYACMTPQCMNAQGKILSHRNFEFADKLDNLSIPYIFEKRLGNYSYDICIENQKIVIELDPTYTHNIHGNHWGNGILKNYHLNKTNIAKENGYRCIHIFDWDNENEIIDIIKPKNIMYAKDFDIWKINNEVGNKFLIQNHLQGKCKGATLMLGLVKNNELYELMTFGNPRYNKNYDVELLRLCTLKGISIIGGASKLFKFATRSYMLNNIISYCDLSKFTGNVYEKMGMTHLKDTPPQEIWSKGSKRITANLLRQRGFDQLFHTSYGKGTDNEKLMLDDGWLPVPDCGQSIYEYRK